MDSMLAPGDLQSSGDTKPTVGKHGNFWRFHGHRGFDCGFDGRYRALSSRKVSFSVFGLYLSGQTRSRDYFSSITAITSVAALCAATL